MRPTILNTLAILGATALVAACGASSETPSAPTGSSPPDAATPSSTPTSTRADEPVVATPMLGRVLAPPIPVPATDGKVHLAYELYLTNATAHDVDVDSVTVKAGDADLLSLSGDELSQHTRILAGSGGPTRTFGPAQSGLVWLDVALDGPTPQVPQDLSHSVAVSLSEPMPPILPARLTEDLAKVTVSTHRPAVIAPPLDGPNWLAANSCCTDMTSHRMAVNPINGELWAAERFAIDYLQLAPDGTVVRGDPSRLESYPFYGADIHAVADGPVVSVLDGLPEQTPGKGPVGLKLEEYAGNHVVQDIGDGNYVLYAHLKTVAVKPGDRLSTGQTLGNLGNTGNTDAPHLHFHVMSGPDPLMADGLPFVFDSFRLDGRITSGDAVGPLLEGKPAPMEPGVTAREETKVSPLELDVMTYANR